MSFPSSNHTQHLPDNQSSQAQQSTSRASRPARRGLPPISTQAPSAANSPATRHILSRNSSASSTSSVLSPTQQQQQQQRSISSGVTSTPISATLPPAPQSAGRRFARASQQPQSVSASPISAQSSGAPSGQLTSLVVTQLNILLSTLKDDKKWEVQAEKIQKLVDAHGMDVSTTYFRRLLQSNAPLIFSSNQNAQRSASDGGSYPLLVSEMQKLTRMPSQAAKIADALDTNTDGDLFKDFDLSTFMDHFRLDPTAKVTLALACKLVSKQDIKTKADAILSNNYSPFLETIANPTADDISSSFLSSILFRLILDPPRQWNKDAQEHLLGSLNERFVKLRTYPSSEVSAFIAFMDLIPTNTALVRPIQREGPRATSSVDSCKDVLARVDQISPQLVAVALAYMLLSDESYDIGVFVSAVRQHPQAQNIDWYAVVKAFDMAPMRITKSQFLALYNALLPIARETDTFDIQCLWGGSWLSTNAQLSFVTAFLSCSPQELDASQIPRLRAAFSMDEFADASDEVKAYAQKAVSHPMVSLEATKFLFHVIFQSQDAYNQAQNLGIPEIVINANTDIFVCAASACEKPWAALQEMALNQLFRPFFHKSLPNYDFVLHALWKHDKSWLASKLVEAYNADPTLLAIIFEHARQHAWTDTLLLITNEFGLDLAAYGHGQGEVDLEVWAQGHLEISPQQLAGAVVTFLRIKAEDEQSVQRDHPHQVVPLKVKTVYALLNVIHGHLSDEEIGAIQRVCLQVYPRLINYGYKFDHVIDANGENGNSLSEDADAKMQEQYKMMYSNEVDPRGMIERLQHLKESEDPADQDLFACMIHGLFDEYNCFGEYPLEALATTAVLFGGIINFGVLSSRVTLGVALFMVLDAVAEYGPEDSMYKFGLQALLHFINRLEEWPSFCNRLIAIPHLRGTEVWTKAEEVVRRQPGLDLRSGGDLQPELSLPNGNLEDFVLESQYPPFRSIHVDAPLRPEIYEEPDEETSDKVMFVLNNVSKNNIEEKFQDLESALEERHHQWFANYLVEDLAKAQPNFQSLYMQLLTMFDEKILYAEVLRETYSSVSRILNAEATMNNSQDRTNLKNLATWLGMLTLARDQPILHRNLSFKDLLIEAHQTQRLLIAIPFTCKVLSQAKDSKVFRPPQPWLMELISFLVELYDYAELKLNLKFEIEVLCKDLGLDHKEVEPASIIRTLPLHLEGELLQQYPTDTMDGFGDMHLMSLSKRAPSERFSSQDVLKSLPDLGAMLNYPPSSGSISQAQLKNIFLEAAQRAITEIIAPVVERSVTIAAISTSQLVEKDFAMEPDPDRLSSCAHNVVKALSGSLALVTCKEPLRMSISNNIRILAAQNLREPLPEGSILMFVNDNLDTVCKLVEDAAESQSMAEIDAQIQESMERRKRHNEQRPSEPFNFPAVSRWAFFIPDPYRQEPGGLNPQQLAIYEEFGRQMRLPAAPHANAVSQDNTRQLQELTDNYLTSLPTPAEAPAVPRQGQQQQRVVPTQGQTNGYMTTDVLMAHVFEALAELQRVAHEAPEEHIGEIGPSSPVREAYAQLMRMIESSPDKEHLALATVQRATLFAYTKSETRLEIEVFVEVLNHLCLISVTTARNLTIYLQSIDDDKVYNGPVTVCLLKTGLLDIHHVDLKTSQAIMQKKTVAVEFLGALIDELILSEHPAALRADFVLSFGALGQWLSEDPSIELGKDIIKKLQDVSNGAPPPSPPASDKQDQLEYVFEEWVRLQRPEVPERYLVAFIQQLQSRSLLSNQEEFSAFLRVCLEMSLDCFEREALTYGSLDHAYIHVDALAKMIASLVAYQSEGEGVLSGSKTDYLKAILGLLVLVMNHHQTSRAIDRFNDRVFFRLMSSLLCELSSFRAHLGDDYQDLILVFGKAFLALQPKFFPMFTFSWLALISHRMFVPEVMRSADRKGWDIYLQILQVLFSFLGDLVSTQEISVHAAEFYRGVLRVLLILQHDFPEFLTENHMRLNSSVPAGLLQLQNVINCAYPSSFQELPDPFTPGLKMNRLEQVRQLPHLRGGLEDVLSEAGINVAVENLLQGKDIKDDDVKTVIDGIDAEGKPDTLIINALILHIGNTATAGSSVFSPSATPSRVIERLLHESRHELRYQLLSAITNQIRYPNAHTHYFSTALLHLFTVSSEELQQQVARVLVERVMSSRPHPWGLLVTVLELVKNNSYNIWELGWMKAAPEVERMMLNVAHSSGLAQSPRAMT